VQSNPQENIIFNYIFSDPMGLTVNHTFLNAVIMREFGRLELLGLLKNIIYSIVKPIIIIVIFLMTY
jgi:hypothetical protein